MDETSKDAPQKVKIERTEESPIDGSVTVFLTNRECFKFDRCELQLNSLESLLQSVGMGVCINDRVDVVQYGHKVGELPSFWHPGLAKSHSPFFDYRRGDLRMEDGKWIAHHSLGARDLDCLVGFVRKS